MKPKDKFDAVRRNPYSIKQTVSLDTQKTKNKQSQRYLQRNHKANNIYNDVCSQAKERSLQEQLDKLREKHSSRLEKVKGQKG